MSYAASKAGLLGLTRSLAVEAAGVRSNAIVPGYIDTPMIAGRFLVSSSCLVSLGEIFSSNGYSRGLTMDTT